MKHMDKLVEGLNSKSEEEKKRFKELVESDHLNTSDGGHYSSFTPTNLETLSTSSPEFLRQT